MLQSTAQAVVQAFRDGQVADSKLVRTEPAFLSAYLALRKEDFVQLRKELYAEMAMSSAVDWLNGSTELVFEGKQIRIFDGPDPHQPSYAAVKAPDELLGRLLFDSHAQLIAWLLAELRPQHRPA